MTTGTEPGAASGDRAPTSLLDALFVYAEPLTAGAHVVVIGDAESGIADRLLDLGARGVHVFDPDAERATRATRSAPRGVTIRGLAADLDVRDGAFDLAIVTDLASLEAPRESIARLRRAVAASGAVVTLGRARVTEDGAPEMIPFASELGPATLEYSELYDLFAGDFEDVALVGVVPFRGVVFAELGSEDEAPAVSVDTRLASAPPPSVFVVIASGTDARGLTRAPLDPYSIVQVPEDEHALPREATVALEAAFAAAQLKAELVVAQLEEMRERLVVADVRAVESAARIDRLSAERDAALTRAMELEVVLAAAQQAMATLERRLLEAQQGCLDRDDRLAILSADLDKRHSEEAEAAAASNLASVVDELTVRAERAERTLAAREADLANVAEQHGAEMAGFEAQLTDRARHVASLEKELVRREQLVKELVTSLEDAREGSATGQVFETAAPLSAPTPPALTEEVSRLKRKLDELAAEVARREGELTARAWRITELENDAMAKRATRSKVEGRKANAASNDSDDVDLDRALGRARDELDALRQALAQEHAARIAAESGEELARARSELARQAALLEQMRGRLQSS